MIGRITTKLATGPTLWPSLHMGPFHIPLMPYITLLLQWDARRHMLAMQYEQHNSVSEGFRDGILGHFQDILYSDTIHRVFLHLHKWLYFATLCV